VQNAKIAPERALSDNRKDAKKKEKEHRRLPDRGGWWSAAKEERAEECVDKTAYSRKTSVSDGFAELGKKNKRELQLCGDRKGNN